MSAQYTHNLAGYAHSKCTLVSMYLDTIWRSCSQGRYPGRDEGEVEEFVGSASPWMLFPSTLLSELILRYGSRE